MTHAKIQYFLREETHRISLAIKEKIHDGTSRNTWELLLLKHKRLN